MYKIFVTLLENRKITAYKVAKETGLSPSLFSDWKSGRSKPKFDKLLILAKYFEVPVEYFADDAEKENKNE